MLHCAATPDSCTVDTLTPISSALLDTPWATTITSMPGTITPPTPDVGTSTSAVPVTVSTLSLTLPLLRLCSAGSPTTIPIPIMALVARILSAIPAYPAPPLEVGIEVSVLMPNLPEVISAPLRVALSGMMAELSNATAAGTDLFPSDISMSGQNPAPIEGTNGIPAPIPPAQATSSKEDDPVPTLASPFAGPAPIPMSHAVSFLLAYAQRESRYARVVEQGLWSSHVDIIRVGRAFRVDSASFVLNLVEGAIVAVLDRYQQLDRQFEEALVFWMEHLPDMLKWWKEHGTEEWPYPASLTLGSVCTGEMLITQNNVAECVKTAMETCRSGLQNAWTFLQKEYQRRVAAAEAEDDNTNLPSVEEA